MAGAEQQHCSSIAATVKISDSTAAASALLLQALVPARMLTCCWQADVFNTSSWKRYLKGAVGLVTCLGGFGSNEAMLKVCSRCHATSLTLSQQAADSIANVAARPQIDVCAQCSARTNAPLMSESVDADMW